MSIDENCTPHAVSGTAALQQAQQEMEQAVMP
jgi:hypothetical protein